MDKSGCMCACVCVYMCVGVCVCVCVCVRDARVHVYVYEKNQEVRGETREIEKEIHKGKRKEAAHICSADQSIVLCPSQVD